MSSVPEQRPKARPIQAQSAAIARVMARIGSDKPAWFGVVSGHARTTLRPSELVKYSGASERASETVSI